ncbi:uncharacterized protein LOC141854329 isoform X2 [Brevipalpus obovatus]|uniref:uncharacterized protein LOC141854329 isoform X2 n=1 Tax=Brevipalpus obovatus TaxID=246614 RepID=UPI003D9EC39F
MSDRPVDSPPPPPSRGIADESVPMSLVDPKSHGDKDGESVVTHGGADGGGSNGSPIGILSEDEKVAISSRMDTKDLLASTDDLLASSAGMGSIPPQLIGDDDFLMSTSIPSENLLTQSGAIQDDIVNLLDTSTSSTTSFESKHLIDPQQSSALTLDDSGVDNFLKALQPKPIAGDDKDNVSKTPEPPLTEEISHAQDREEGFNSSKTEPETSPLTSTMAETTQNEDVNAIKSAQREDSPASSEEAFEFVQRPSDVMGKMDKVETSAVPMEQKESFSIEPTGGDFFESSISKIDLSDRISTMKVSESLSEFESSDLLVKKTSSPNVESLPKVDESVTNQSRQSADALFNEAFMMSGSAIGSGQVSLSATSEVKEEKLQEEILDAVLKIEEDYNVIHPPKTSTIKEQIATDLSSPPVDQPKIEKFISESPVCKKTVSNPVEQQPQSSEKKKDKPSKMSTSASEDETVTSSCECPFGFISKLIYWRDVKLSGVAFASGLLLLLSLACCSIISVVSYLSLALLGSAIAFRAYKSVMQAVNKLDEGHPFQKYLDLEIKPSDERVHQTVDIVLQHGIIAFNKLRKVFLVEDIVDSLKYLAGFWALTYIGSWFNGITLITLSFIALFSVPKFYEMNKAQIDGYLTLACNQMQGICSTIRSKLPIPASSSSKKEK